MGVFNDALKANRNEELPYFLWLNKSSEMTFEEYLLLENYFSSPREVFYSSKDQIEKLGILKPSTYARLFELKAKMDIAKEYENMLRTGIRLIPYGDDNYPERLINIPDPPKAIFVKGQLPMEEDLTISVIGARECSEYGKLVAARLGELIAGNGIPLISGMARGIDSLSQIAALNAGGYSIAVLGGGVDIVYPKESQKLYERLCRTGAVISEYAPKTPPLPVSFVRRNRIISGLSDIVIVVEARLKSGTMITVDAALEQGKEVYVVPGRITDTASRGCLELIKTGAGLITNPEEFICEISQNYIANRFMKKISPKEDRIATGLTQIEKTIVLSFCEESFTVDDALSKSGGNVDEVLGALFGLCEKGLLNNMGAGRFCFKIEGIVLRNQLIEKRHEKFFEKYIDK